MPRLPTNASQPPNAKHRTLNAEGLLRGILWVIFFGAVSGTLVFGQAPGNASVSSTVRLNWDKSPGRDVRGYRLHYGTTSGSYQGTIDAGKKTTCKISNLIAGRRYYFAVVAYNAAGKESPPSNECSFIPPVSASSRRKSH
jgi:hypothetical protein